MANGGPHSVGEAESEGTNADLGRGYGRQYEMRMPDDSALRRSPQAAAMAGWWDTIFCFTSDCRSASVAVF